MPVLTGRVAVTFDVTNKLCIGLAGCIETERGLNLVVLQVAVDGLRTTDDLHAILLGSIVLSQHAGIGVGVVATDDDECLDVEFAKNFYTLLKLLYLFKLRAAGTNHVKTAGVAIVFQKVFRDFNILVVYETARTHKETIKMVLGVQLLDTIEKTTDHIVSTRSLTTAEDNSHIHLCGIHHFSWFKLYERHSVGVGEEGFDFFLIVNALCRSTFLDFHCALKCLRQLRLIGCSCNLQCTFFHVLSFNIIMNNDF